MKLSSTDLPLFQLKFNLKYYKQEKKKKEKRII